MTWAEFQIRLFSYRRIKKEEMERLRMLMYNNTLAPHRDPKKIPKSIERFLPLEGKQGITESQKQAILNAQKQYNERIKSKN